MTVALSDLQNSIYEILSKSSTAYGLLTPTKVTNMINDSLQHISTNMMKINGGWLQKVAYGNIVANSPYVSLPSDMAILNFAKRKNDSSTAYVPMEFSENWSGNTETTPIASGTVSNNFRFVNGKMYLEPTPATAISQGVMFTYFAFPVELVSSSDVISGDLNNQAFIQYAKWRAASQLYALTNENTPPWKQYEAEWYQNCMAIISRRFRTMTPIQAFQDY